MTIRPEDQLSVGRASGSLLRLSLALAVLVACGIAFRNGLRDLVMIWTVREEYSFGFMVPAVAAYLMWQRRGRLAGIELTGSWGGAILVLVAVGLAVVGVVGMVATFGQYAVLLTIVGLLWSYLGTRAMARLAMPVALLAFMVPLPAFLLGDLSQSLQLLSSKLGTWIIRLAGISVFVEGNIIDLGTMRLQVVEACSGLRYLFPLITLAFIAASLYRGAIWKRCVLVLSAVPITVLMNSARIGMIGILAEYFGKGMAEGFLHDFEGWAVFLVCTLLLIGEMMLLAKLGSDKASFGESFGFDDEPPAEGFEVNRPLPLTLIVAAGIIIVSAVAMLAAPERREVIPERQTFSEFPAEFGGWQASFQKMEPAYLELLHLTDYVLADYSNPKAAGRVNLYISYYDSQTSGYSAHSPRACMPGDGWEIASLGAVDIPEVRFANQVMRANRAVIAKGELRQVAYYWFQQRGAITLGEYETKLSIFKDSLNRRRSDGAMIRMISEIRPGEAESDADGRLRALLQFVMPTLGAYVPE